jgi:hypothetical protein
MGIKTNRLLNPEQQAENLDRFQRNIKFPTPDQSVHAERLDFKLRSNAPRLVLFV